jgi:long-chain fatty acid transport protein
MMAGAFTLAMGISTAAFAGSFARLSADTDILFEPGRTSFRGGVTYVDPNRKMERNQVPGLRGTEYSKPEWLPSFAAKFEITDEFSCAATYTRPFSANSEFDVMNNRGKLEEKFHVDEYGATCAYFVPVGPGRFFVLGGVFASEFNYDFGGFTVVPGVGLTPMKFDLNDTAFGYRLGLGYEIPEKAFRAQVLYRSGENLSGDGTAHLTSLNASLPVTGAGDLPQSVELRAQSGIAEDWVAYGSIKWTDWSSLDTLDMKLGNKALSNYYYYRDGLTVSGGVGHKFNDAFTGLVGVSWDRGVSTGWDMMGDSVTVSAGVNYKDNWGGDLRFIGAVIHNSAVDETKYAPGANSSSASSNGYLLQVSYKKSF